MNKMNKVNLFVAALVMTVAVAASAVVAQSTGQEDRGGRRAHGRQEGGFRGDRMGFGFRDLDLTDAQREQFKQIREGHRQNLQPLMEQIRAKRQEIRQAGEGGTFDEALVSRKLAEIAPLEAKLMGEQFRIRQEMLSVLTPEQKAKLEQQKSTWTERRARKGRKTL